MVAVIDVLRASTSIAVALANGAKTVIPFDSADEAVLRSKSFERPLVRLAGERRMRPIPASTWAIRRGSSRGKRWKERPCC